MSQIHTLLKNPGFEKDLSVNFAAVGAFCVQRFYAQSSRALWGMFLHTFVVSIFYAGLKFKLFQMKKVAVNITVLITN